MERRKVERRGKGIKEMEGTGKEQKEKEKKKSWGK